jgi:hypothetical protein
MTTDRAEQLCLPSVAAHVYEVFCNHQAPFFRGARRGIGWLTECRHVRLGFDDPLLEHVTIFPFRVGPRQPGIGLNETDGLPIARCHQGIPHAEQESL